MASPSSVAKTRIHVGTNTVTGAIQRYVIAGTFRSVDVRVNTTARLIHANLNWHNLNVIKFNYKF